MKNLIIILACLLSHCEVYSQNTILDDSNIQVQTNPISLNKSYEFGSDSILYRPHTDSFRDNENGWLIPNTDTIKLAYAWCLGCNIRYTKASFLPYKLDENIETGNYKIYQKGINNSRLLIEANILNGKLHGVYNEYDPTSGKIKIYAVYYKGKLNGRRTTYYYNKRNELVDKWTELWENNTFIDIVP